MRYELGQSITLQDIVDKKYCSYPLMKVPDEEVVDYEKLHELFRHEWDKHGVFEEFVIMVMLTIGQEMVPNINAPSDLVFSELSLTLRGWRDFLNISSHMLGFWHIKEISSSKPNITFDIIRDFCFYGKIK